MKNKQKTTAPKKIVKITLSEAAKQLIRGGPKASACIAPPKPGQ